jgi:hypothetical protein
MRISGLNRRSWHSVGKGTAFELGVLAYLSKFPVLLQRSGGANDGGIDIRGIFLYHTNPNFIVQCKNESKKTSSLYFRELEGVLIREQGNTIGIMATANEWSKPALNRFQFSQFPIMGMVFSDNSIEFRIQKVLLNLKLQTLYPWITVEKSLSQNVTLVFL